MTTAPSIDVAANVRAVRQRIINACARVGRSPSEVKLIGASKLVDVERLKVAYEAGLTDFGENWVQEAKPKIDALRSSGIHATWHMIGHLQTNKVNATLRYFDTIDGVDTVHLAAFISRRALRPVPILLEVNVAEEPTKTGLRLSEVKAALDQILTLPNLRVDGLMTIAPLEEDPETVRPVFRELRNLGERLGLKELSMGMTDDFEVAIEEGSTMVRIGRALFGPRPEH